MEYLIFFCWYLSGIIALFVFLQWPKRKKREDLSLLILAGLLGPLAFLIGLLLKNIPNRQSDRYQSRDLP